MPANAATNTDVQSDAFAEIVLANLNAPVQADVTNPTAFPQILNGGIATGYIATLATSCCQAKGLDVETQFKMSTEAGFLCMMGKSYQRRLGVKGDRTYLPDKTLSSGRYLVDEIRTY